MAAAACFGGPVFQLLMGTGVSLLYVNLERGAVPVHMGNNLHVLFAFAMLMQAYYLIGAAEREHNSIAPPAGFIPKRALHSLRVS